MIRARAVAFVDADDVITPRYAERMLGGLDAESDAVACWHSIVGPTLEDLDWTVSVRADELDLESLCRFNPLAIGAVLFRREAFDRLAAHQGSEGGDARVETPFRTEDGVLADWGHWLRVAGSGIRWAPAVPESLYLYRMVDGSLSRDVRAMCSDGSRMIGRYAAPGSRAAHLRAWSVRCLARAIAQGDCEAAREYVRELGSWGEQDRDVLLGSLRWAFQFHARVGPAGAGSLSEGWVRAAERALPGFPWAESIRASLSSPRDRWVRAAERALEMMGPGDRLVMYGNGRNGRECSAVLDDLRVEYGVVDDRAGVTGSGHVASPASLDTRCVVLVTPDDHTTLSRSLRERGITRLVNG